MKELWLKWAARIDALSLRERAMAGVAAVAAVVFIAYMGFIEPAGARERTLRNAIREQRAQLVGVDADIAQKLAAAKADPDAAERRRLAALQADNAALRTSLRTAQQGLVPPARMSVLLQGMVQQSGKLRLVSLKTLPPAGTTDGHFTEITGLETAAAAVAGPVIPAGALSQTPPGGTPPPAADQAAVPGKDAPLLYRHGVRIVLQGAYGDMVAYMAALERLPTQLFWGQAALDATEHGKATLTLTLYTLSLDEKWIAL